MSKSKQINNIYFTKFLDFRVQVRLEQSKKKTKKKKTSKCNGTLNMKRHRVWSSEKFKSGDEKFNTLFEKKTSVSNCI